MSVQWPGRSFLGPCRVICCIMTLIRLRILVPFSDYSGFSSYLRNTFHFTLCKQVSDCVEHEPAVVNVKNTSRCTENTLSSGGFSADSLRNWSTGKYPARIVFISAKRASRRIGPRTTLRFCCPLRTFDLV